MCRKFLPPYRDVLHILDMTQEGRFTKEQRNVCDVPLFLKGVEGLVTAKVGPVVSGRLEWD